VKVEEKIHGPNYLYFVNIIMFWWLQHTHKLG